MDTSKEETTTTKTATESTTTSMPYSELTTTIQTAVASVVEKSDLSTADLNNAIRQAIESVLKEQGDSSKSGSSAAVSSGEFAQMLDTYGISTQQFQNDLKGAFQSTKGVNVTV